MGKILNCAALGLEHLPQHSRRGLTIERFSDRVALITGATGGIGSEICRRLAAEGAVIVLADHPGTDPGAAASHLPAEPQLAVELDVADEGHWAAAIEHITQAHGRLYALVNNAAIGSIKTVEDETPEHRQRVINVDQTGVWLGMKHAGTMIDRSGGGAIVNVSSILGSVGGFGNSFAYHAAKGAVHNDQECGHPLDHPRSSRQLPAPGVHRDPQLLERYEGSEHHRGMLQNTPMGRLGTPAEIAACVAFLASDDAGFITGA